MTHGSLFSGIGGFDLAAHWAGLENRWACEIDPYCQGELRKNFPNSTLYGDIRKTDWAAAPRVDIISGGFPCQPFSNAGEQRGTADNRYLWPAMLGCIKTVRPTWVIGENVAGIVNLALDEVLSSLEAEGYACRAFVIPACAVGAWHRRDRVWILAHSGSAGRQQLDTAAFAAGTRFGARMGHAELASYSEGGQQPQFQGGYHGRPSGAPKQVRLELGAGRRGAERHPAARSWFGGRTAAPLQRTVAHAYNAQPAQQADQIRPGWKSADASDWWELESRVRGVPHGLSERLDSTRNKRIKALGNTIVPQMAEVLFEAILSVEATINH